MSTTSCAKTWKTPNEILRLQQLRRKTSQLAVRCLNISKSNDQDEKTKALEEVAASKKRKNPFAKSEDTAKKPKFEQVAFDIHDDSLFNLISQATAPLAAEKLSKEPSTSSAGAKLKLQPLNTQIFANLPGSNSEDEEALKPATFSKQLPMDWSLKTRIRFFRRQELPKTKLSNREMASGLTCFARCLRLEDSTNNIDIAESTRFNKATYYWQQPHLPWLTMFPRNAKENTGITIGERESKALANDWDASFRGLYQQLRSHHCPYFYVCANNFTVLFRTSGTAGSKETHAIMTPTTSGMRKALREEGICFSMPLKRGNARAGDARSADNSYEEASQTDKVEEDAAAVAKSADTETNDDCEEQEEEDWLASLGVGMKEISRMKSLHTRKKRAEERNDDFSDSSLVLIEGDADSQGFFSFLLNAKSTISNVGRLAGVPPTLLAPVAFPNATMQQLSIRSSKVRMDNEDYNSIEVKGIILPTFLPEVCTLLSETDGSFSALLASSDATLAFSKVTKRLLEEQEHKGDDVFHKFVLKDCGLLPYVVDAICAAEPSAVNLLERICYDSEHGYACS